MQPKHLLKSKQKKKLKSSMYTGSPGLISWPDMCSANTAFSSKADLNGDDAGLKLSPNVDCSDDEYSPTTRVTDENSLFDDVAKQVGSKAKVQILYLVVVKKTYTAIKRMDIHTCTPPPEF